MFRGIIRRRGLKAVQRLGPILPSLHFIQANLDKKIRRLDMARAAHLSPSRFHAIFKELTGRSPVNYLKQRRIDHAAKLIAETGLSIYLKQSVLSV